MESIMNKIVEASNGVVTNSQAKKIVEGLEPSEYKVKVVGSCQIFSEMLNNCDGGENVTGFAPEKVSAVLFGNEIIVYAPMAGGRS